MEHNTQQKFFKGFSLYQWVNEYFFGTRMKFISAYKLAFSCQLVVNGVINLIVVMIVSHLVKPLIRIHKTLLKVKLFLFIEAIIMKTIKDSFIKFTKQQYFRDKLVDYNY